MLLTIMFGVLLVSGIIMLVLYSIYYYEEIVAGIGVIIGLIGLIGFLTCGIPSLITQANLDLDYEKMLQQQQMIEYRLELIENEEIDTYAEIQLYNDILNYNREVLTHRKWAYNNWTSWFYNHKIGGMKTFSFE